MASTIATAIAFPVAHPSVAYVAVFVLALSESIPVPGALFPERQ